MSIEWFGMPGLISKFWDDEVCRILVLLTQITLIPSKRETIPETEKNRASELPTKEKTDQIGSPATLQDLPLLLEKDSGQIRIWRIVCCLFEYWGGGAKTLNSK